MPHRRFINSLDHGPTTKRMVLCAYYITPTGTSTRSSVGPVDSVCSVDSVRAGRGSTVLCPLSSVLSTLHTSLASADRTLLAITGGPEHSEVAFFLSRALLVCFVRSRWRRVPSCSWSRQPQPRTGLDWTVLSCTHTEQLPGHRHLLTGSCLVRHPHSFARTLCIPPRPGAETPPESLVCICS